jgi:hypothetical protein
VYNAGLGTYPHSATTFHFSIAAELEETTVMPETVRLASKVDQKVNQKIRFSQERKRLFGRFGLILTLGAHPVIIFDSGRHLRRNIHLVHTFPEPYPWDLP